jgi:CheY-like chemotaxis protein
MTDTAAGGAACRILVVDDHPDSAEASCFLLSAFGHICAPVTTGEAALAEAEQFQPDLVLCDIGLPDMSGYEVARVLRGRLGDAVYLAAVTGWDQPADLARSVAAGFDQHVIKPATAKVLQSIISASFRHKRAFGRGTGLTSVIP